MTRSCAARERESTFIKFMRLKWIVGLYIIGRFNDYFAIFEIMIKPNKKKLRD